MLEAWRVLPESLALHSYLPSNASSWRAVHEMISCERGPTRTSASSRCPPHPQAQFYAHGMGMNLLQEAIVRSISAFCCCPYNPQAQFYVHGMGMNPSERRARLGMAVVMEAAVLLALVAEYRK